MGTSYSNYSGVKIHPMLVVRFATGGAFSGHSFHRALQSFVAECRVQLQLAFRAVVRCCAGKLEVTKRSEMVKIGGPRIQL